MKGMRTVANVVDGAIPKQTMEMTPRSPEMITLRWSLMIDFKHSQNCKEKKARSLIDVTHQPPDPC